jgi:hypothetical protein
MPFQKPEGLFCKGMMMVMMMMMMIIIIIMSHFRDKCDRERSRENSGI